MINPDFYIRSHEGHLTTIHKCFKIKRLQITNRDDLLLIRVEPPLSGVRYNISNSEVNTLIIATRHRGETLFPIKKWPIDVYVLLPLINNPEDVEVLQENECKLIAWAEIHQTELSAISYG